MKGLTLNELLAWKPPYQQYVISNGLLLPQTKMIMFGKFETWKSMLSYHLTFCIANGIPWFGFYTFKSPVYLLQIEVPQTQLRVRIIKYVTGNQVTSDMVWLCTEHYIKLDKGFGQAELEKELDRTHPKVLIIDPIYKVVSGRMTDEWDMRQFMDRMDILMDKYKFALVLIHHDRKHQLFEGQAIDMGAEDMFGTSIFIDWCDTSIRTNSVDVDLNCADITLTFEKARHAQEVLKPIVVRADRRDLTFKLQGGIQ